MRLLILSIIVLLLHISCSTPPENAELKKEWLKSATTEIFSIDPTDTVFSDLEFLKEELKNVQIIGLGESTHGDGSTFEAKTRLVKFLHEEMGFDVLAFESGVYDCYRGWECLNQTGNIDSAFQKALFKVWAKRVA